MKIHIDDNHCNGKLLLATIKRDRLCTFPRDILLDFNKYCPECRKETCLVTKESIQEEKENIHVRNIIELVDVSDGDDVSKDFIIPKLVCVILRYHPNWDPFQHSKYDLLFGVVYGIGVCIMQTNIKHDH
jgi:hypothetical protein